MTLVDVQLDSNVLEQNGTSFLSLIKRWPRIRIVASIYIALFVLFASGPTVTYIQESLNDKPLNSGSSLLTNLTTGSWLLTKVDPPSAIRMNNFESDFDKGDCWTLFRDGTMYSSKFLDVRSKSEWHEAEANQTSDYLPIIPQGSQIKYSAPGWFGSGGTSAYRWIVKSNHLILTKSVGSNDAPFNISTPSLSISQTMHSHLVLSTPNATYFFEQMPRVQTVFFPSGLLGSLLIFALGFVGLFISMRWQPLSRWRTFVTGWLCTSVCGISIIMYFVLMHVRDFLFSSWEQGIMAAIAFSIIPGVPNGLLRAFVLMPKGTPPVSSQRQIHRHKK